MGCVNDAVYPMAATSMMTAPTSRAMRFHMQTRGCNTDAWLFCGRARSGAPAFLGQPPVEVVSRADHCDVGQPLRKVAEMLSPRPDLLGEQSQMVCVSQELLEHQSGSLQIARSRQTLHVPEGANRKRPLVLPH